MPDTPLFGRSACEVVDLLKVGQPQGEAMLLAHAAALEPILGAPALPIEPRVA